MTRRPLWMRRGGEHRHPVRIRCGQWISIVRHFANRRNRTPEAVVGVVGVVFRVPASNYGVGHRKVESREEPRVLEEPALLVLLSFFLFLVAIPIPPLNQ